MKAKKVLFYCLAALLGGCIPVISLHPLVTKDTLVFDERLIGTWTDDADDPESTWEFTRLAPSDANNLPDVLEGEDEVYRLDFQGEENRQGSFFACLVKLGDKLFLDVFPRTFPSGRADAKGMDLPYNAFLFVPAHTFIKVNAIGNQLKMRLTDDEAFEKLADAVESTVVENSRVMTASTKQLQAFVLKHADDERLFANEIVLSRRSQD